MDESEKREKLEKMKKDHSDILGAITALGGIEEWKVLQELIFDKAFASIEKQILAEAVKPELNLSKIHILQGERNWARRYCDVRRFADFHKSLLEELNNQLR